MNHLRLVKVEGCADIVPPTNTVVQRTGDDVVIRCNKTRETWFLTCKHSKWVGESGSCSHSGMSNFILLYILIRYKIWLTLTVVY